MAKKSQVKRYTKHDEQRLLARVVAFGEGPISATVRDSNAAILRDILGVRGGFQVLGDEARELAAWSPVQIAMFQRTVRNFIRQLIEGAVPEFSTTHLKFGATQPGEQGVLLTVDGPADDVLRFQIVNLLQRTGVGRIRRCDCGRLFGKTGRREFCSDRCQKRVYMRELRRQQKREERIRHGKTTRKR